MGDILGRSNHLSILEKMKIKILGDKDSEAYLETSKLVRKRGHIITEGECRLQLAPLLTEIIPYEEISRPGLGTLIFHPSPLPYGRGAASIKYAYKRREPITAATWFWANDGKVDSGCICESEIIKIQYDLRPKDFYRLHIIPALLRTLDRALDAIENGYIRKVKQVEEYATFDYK